MRYNMMKYQLSPCVYNVYYTYVWVWTGNEKVVSVKDP